jgi:hypothetical protein
MKWHLTMNWPLSILSKFLIRSKNSGLSENSDQRETAMMLHYRPFQVYYSLLYYGVASDDPLELAYAL